MYVVWATVVPEETGRRPSSDATAILADRRAQQFWDPTRVLAAQVRAAADAGVKSFAEYKTGGHTPYDFVAVYRAGKSWAMRMPTPGYVGAPVASSIEALAKAIGGGR